MLSLPTTILLSILVSNNSVAPLHTYNSVESGVMIQVNLDPEVDVAHLVLLDNNNVALAPRAAVTSGTHDVVRRIPEILQLKESAWVQLYVAGEAIDSPIVIQPMNSREVPKVEDSLRPDGTTVYPKIIDWVDEAEEDNLETPFISGWRVYVEQDVVISTSEGDIRVSLRPDVAPNTVWNFRELARGDFYHNTTFHRIVPMTSKGHPFVIQGGDPTGTGSGGPGYWLPIENSDLPHDFGVISMARAGDPDSAGSQFFLCLSREGTARLDGQYCSFGETVEGDDVIRKIAATPLVDPATGTPESPPKITAIYLVAAPSRSTSK